MSYNQPCKLLLNYSRPTFFLCLLLKLKDSRDGKRMRESQDRNRNRNRQRENKKVGKEWQ